MILLNFKYLAETQNTDVKLINSETTDVKEQQPKRICLVGSLASNENINKVAKSFQVPVVLSETGLELLVDKPEKVVTYFILDDFEGPIFETLSKTKHK